MEIKDLEMEFRNATNELVAKLKEGNEAAAKQIGEVRDALRKEIKDQSEALNKLAVEVGTLKAVGSQSGEVKSEERQAFDKAFARAIRTVNADSHELNAMAGKAFRSQMIESDNSQGGFFVRPELSERVITGSGEGNIMRDLATVETIGSNVLQIPAFPNGVKMNIAATETENPVESERGKVYMHEIPVADVDITVPVSRDLLADSAYDLEGLLARVAAEGFADGELEQFTVGTGKIKGLWTAPKGSVAGGSTVSYGTFGYIPSGNASSIPDADGLFALVNAVKSRYRRNGAFMASPAALVAIRQLKKGANNGYLLWNPSLIPGEPDTLLGYPVHENDYAPAIAANAFPVAFGDFAAAYTVADREGMYLLVSNSAASKRVVEYTWFKRVGGGPVDSRAVAFLKVATA